MARFGRVVTAMVTPFDESGALDVDAAADLARWLVAHGNDGLVLAGSTGEGSVLDDDEKVALWQAVRAAVDVPIVAGSTSNDTAHSVAPHEARHGRGRRRHPRGHPVLQPPVAGRHRGPHAGRRGRQPTSR